MRYASPIILLLTFCYCYVANCHRGRRRRRLGQMLCARTCEHTNMQTTQTIFDTRTQCRDGLEKMEREKLRQAERDREMKERDEKRRQEKLIEQNLLMQLNANEASAALPAKSKFVCNSLSHSILILFLFCLFSIPQKNFDTKILFTNYFFSITQFSLSIHNSPSSPRISFAKTKNQTKKNYRQFV